VIETLSLRVPGQGLHSITERVASVVVASGLAQGLCHLFIMHTSASLLIQENYDDSAKVDLEAWLNRLVPENDPLYTHTLEGPDDMPAHIKAALTASSLTIPFDGGQLCLGSWQGVYLWEHRHGSQQRQLVVAVAAL